MRPEVNLEHSPVELMVTHLLSLENLTLAAICYQQMLSGRLTKAITINNASNNFFCCNLTIANAGYKIN